MSAAPAKGTKRTTRARRPKKAQTFTEVCAGFLKKTLLPDLVARSKATAVLGRLQTTHAREKKAGRTGESFIAWRDQLLEQVGAAWILSVVFVRTLEDRELLDRRRIAGPGAEDSRELFFAMAPSLSTRDYLLTIFGEMARLPAGKDVFDRSHNLVWHLAPSADAARALLDLFLEQSGEGQLRWTFGQGDTRFLGDLYQDLSEGVRKRYALLQTPDFVEEFILDETLDPAIETYGLEAVRLIDPTSGSGHFLLGAYDRLFRRRLQAAPGHDPKALAAEALDQVYGVDINPYAVAIARFRLTLSYLEKAGITRLSQAPELHPNLVVADSLLYGGKLVNRDFGELARDKAAWGGGVFELEDPVAAKRLFATRFHAVVGNPPYITPKDPILRDMYRVQYVSAAGKYALAAPFTERFFELAVDGGFVGLINANSFMKREFGKKLVEEVLPRLDLTAVIDSSGAYIPGHGTPTVFLFGRNRAPMSDTVAAVLGRRGEPTTPSDPAHGEVWGSIQVHWREAGFENDYISVTQVPRETLAAHPWSLEGGGAAELKILLESRAAITLGDVVSSIGFMAITGEDEVFARPRGAFARAGVEPDWCKPFGIGEEIRDWAAQPSLEAFFPYRDAKLQQPSVYPQASKALWPYRRTLLNRPDFGGKKYIDVGRTWFEYHQVPLERLRVPCSIAFVFVATHNHFVLDRGGKVFKQSAPIIKLPEGATEEDHLALLGYLNSSTACFWMKQVAQPKTVTTGEKILQPDPSKIAYEFTGTHLQSLPLPKPVHRMAVIDATRQLVSAAERRTKIRQELARVFAEEERPNDVLDNLGREDHALLRRMVQLQEVLDVLAYDAFGIIGDSPAQPLRDAAAEAIAQSEDGLETGDRAFNGGCGQGLPALVADVTAQNSAMAQVETPAYKRRWIGVQGRFRAEGATWQEETLEAAKQWLLARAEDVARDSQVPRSAAAIAREMMILPAVTRVTAYLGLGHWSELEKAIRSADADVPFLAAMRFSAAGLEKHLHWKRVWELQRREDSSEYVGEIPVPPRYKPTDYSRGSYWTLRGKLDVPKEAFISYPGAEKDDDPSPLYGWAGWDHLQRAQALAGLYQERKVQDGWGGERLTPLLAGLLELVPWLKQWHNEPDPDFGEPMGDWFEGMVETEAREHGLSLDDLRAWRPAPKTRGRRKKKE